mgnify:CR=1 FL=1
MVLGGPHPVIALAVVLLAAGSLSLLILAVLTAGAGRGTRERLRQYTDAAPDAAPDVAQAAVLRQRRLSTFRALDALLRNNPLAEAAGKELAAARVPLRVGEYFGLMLFCGVMGGCIALALTRSPVAAGTAVLIGALAPKIHVARRRSQRVKGCEDQLVDMLSLTSNSLRSGWSFVQALENVTKELPAPISDEIRQVLEEVSLGATAEDALMDLQKRIPSYDLELIVTAVLIQRRAGGNLAEMMDTIGHTIRERLKLLGEVRIITAEARMSMWLLALLPVCLFLIMSMLNPAYINPMIEDARGQLILVGAVVMELAGVFMLRRMANIQV